MLFTAIKFFHILFALGAVGFNASYAVWLARARDDPHDLAFALKGIKFLDDRLANPFYGLLLLTGLGMVVVGGLPLTTRWIDAALVLYLIAIAIGIGGYSPALRRQIAALESGGPTSPGYLAASRRGTITGIAVSVVVLAIIGLMVFKPAI
jgi:uncharacterized membrane protein